jgi:O-antigen/teichoic acid export membrane protein
VLGAAGYAFVAVVGHVMHEPSEAGSLSALISLYLLVNIVGPGIFAALEQATSRAVSAAATRGEPVAPIARRTGVLTLWSLGILVVAVLAAWPLVLARVLDDQVGLLVALLVAVAGSGAVYWVRGLLGGQQRFAAYAGTLYVEGAVRLVPCLILLALAVAPLLGIRGGGEPTVPLERIGRSYAYLLGAIALSQLLANLAPVVVSYRMPDDLVRAGVFGTTFVLARIPLFLFAPVQAVLLPHVTRAATQGRYAELVTRLRQAALLVTALGVVGAVACVWLGPWAAEVLFNTATRPTPAVLGLLGAATLLMMLALVVQPTLIALGRQRWVTSAWAAGAVVFLALLVLPGDPITAALIAQLAGPLVVLVLLSVGVVSALRTDVSGRTAGSVATGGE